MTDENTGTEQERTPQEGLVKVAVKALKALPRGSVSDIPRSFGRSFNVIIDSAISFGMLGPEPAKKTDAPITKYGIAGATLGYATAIAATGAVIYGIVETLAEAGF